MTDALAQLPALLTAHLALTLAALAGGILLAVPAGILAHRVKALEAPVLGAAGVLQTIPALALLAVMVPLLAALGLPGIGKLPAFLGLLLYSLLPILRNTVAGLASVDPDAVEAARGLGMTENQVLRLVELPLALPVVLAGIRTAAVWTVGMATLATPVGAASLGAYIFGGLQTRRYPVVLLGCAASAALALLLDGLLGAVARGAAQRRRRLAGAGGAGLALLACVALWSLAEPWLARTAPASRPVRIGAKTFTEQYVLAEVLAGQVRRAARAPAEVVASLGSTVAFDALVRGEIDAYVDYTGTLWTTLMHRTGAGASRAAVLAGVTEWLARTHGVTVAASLGFENAYCLALRRERAAALGVASLSDLARVSRGLDAAADYEFWSRPEWSSLERVYGLAFASRRTMDPSLLYAAVAAGEVDVITAYSSDARIASHALVTLADPRGAIPPYDAVVLVGPRLARERPGVVAALAALGGTIDVARMRALNGSVDSGGLSPQEAARSFLEGPR